MCMHIAKQERKELSNKYQGFFFLSMSDFIDSQVKCLCLRQTAGVETAGCFRDGALNKRLNFGVVHISIPD